MWEVISLLTPLCRSYRIHLYSGENLIVIWWNSRSSNEHQKALSRYHAEHFLITWRSVACRIASATPFEKFRRAFCGNLIITTWTSRVLFRGCWCCKCNFRAKYLHAAAKNFPPASSRILLSFILFFISSRGYNVRSIYLSRCNIWHTMPLSLCSRGLWLTEMIKFLLD